MIEKDDKHFTLIKKEDRYEKLEKILSPSLGDTTHSIIEGSLSLIPGAGGVLAKLFSTSVESPLQKRKRDFLIWLAIRLDDLETKGILSTENFKNNEEFNDLILRSLEISMKNSRDEKLQALRNVLINSILKIDEKDDIHYVFLQIVDELTPMHIQALKEFANLPHYTYEHQSIVDLKRKFENYLSELVSTGLLYHVPQEGGSLQLEQSLDSPEYSVTKKGRLFLEYLQNIE